MSSKTVLVYCLDCAGTGIGKEGYTQCEYCLGQMHIAINRAPDGGVPDGYRLWREYTLPDIRVNPLILSSDATPT
jgi:hypothetical protein